MDIFALGIAADIVYFARAADFEHALDRAAVIADVKPVADILTVPVNR